VAGRAGGFGSAATTLVGSDVHHREAEARRAPRLRRATSSAGGVPPHDPRGRDGSPVDGDGSLAAPARPPPRSADGGRRERFPFGAAVEQAQPYGRARTAAQSRDSYDQRRGGSALSGIEIGTGLPRFVPRFPCECAGAGRLG
jgi:hypothetical protein